MKHAPLSLTALLLIGSILLFTRLYYSPKGNGYTMQVTTWDALGYYSYLPAAFIYHDYQKMAFIPKMNKKYKLTGGDFYQWIPQKNGKVCNRYLMGVALMEAPFFFLGHGWAAISGYPQDGFSAPYQWSLSLGLLIWAFAALWLFRRLLLYFFSDKITTAVLLLSILATNAVQYLAVDSGQSHGWIFGLYVLVLWATVRWHKHPTPYYAAILGFSIALATVSRPTELIMLLIPLLWNTHTTEAQRQKWESVKAHRSQLWWAFAAALPVLLLQMLYWQQTTGSLLYSPGSKWYFLTPWFRVLFGFEKGWFVYTPISLLIMAGLFMMKDEPFKKALLWFGLLNIWIIISWADWHYGGAYSTRALMQSLPVYALALGSFFKKLKTPWRSAFYLIGAYLLAVNLFQVWQYNRGIIHYYENNARYYAKIYLNAEPEPAYFSLLDSPDFVENETGYSSEVIAYQAKEQPVTEADTFTYALRAKAARQAFIKIDVDVIAFEGFDKGRLHLQINKQANSVRLARPLAAPGQWNPYIFYTRTRLDSAQRVSFTVQAKHFRGKIRKLHISLLAKP